jgi:hypothetical protein
VYCLRTDKAKINFNFFTPDMKTKILIMGPQIEKYNFKEEGWKLLRFTLQK